MSEELPIYTNGQKTGNVAVSRLKGMLQRFCLINDISKDQDLGIDLTGTVLDNNRPTELNFNIQSKGTDDIETKTVSDGYSYPIKVSTINYWKQKKDVTFLFLVDIENNKAYWADALDYLKDKDYLQQKTVNIRIPKENCISFETGRLPSEFTHAILKYYANFSEPVVNQLKSISKAIFQEEGSKQLIEIFDILFKNVQNVNATCQDWFLSILNKIMRDLDKTIHYASKLDQMDDLVRANYCHEGVFNDKAFGYDGKTLKQVIQEIREIEKSKLGDDISLEKLEDISKKVENIEGNVLGFYREMLYEDMPFTKHEDIDKDFEEFMQRRKYA